MRRGRFDGRNGIAILCILAVALVGCPRHEAREARVARQAVLSLEDMRLELILADQQVADTLTAMNQLVEAPTELPQRYRTFTAEVSRTVDQRSRAQHRAERMQSQWRAYIDRWQQELEEVTSPELRATAAERRQAVRQNFERIRREVNDVQAAYDPFIQQLQDIQRALALDLTPAGVQAAGPAIGPARQTGNELRQQIGQVIAEIDNAIMQRAALPAPGEPVAGSQ